MPERQTFTRDRLSVRGLANWILDLADASQVPITNMALNKLVYFVIEKALVERNRLLTDAKIEAWEHGPVFREIYHQFKSYGDKPITSRAGFYSVETGNVEISKAELPEEIKGEIGEFIRPLIGLSAAKLRAASHIQGGAWQNVWCHDGYANPGMEITPDQILTSSSA